MTSAFARETANVYTKWKSNNITLQNGLLRLPQEIKTVKLRGGHHLSHKFGISRAAELHIFFQKLHRTSQIVSRGPAETLEAEVVVLVQWKISVSPRANQWACVLTASG